MYQPKEFVSLATLLNIIIDSPAKTYHCHHEEKVLAKKMIYYYVISFQKALSSRTSRSKRALTR